MLESTAQTESLQDEGPFEAALKVALAESEAAGQCGRMDRAMILGLCARIPEYRRALYLSRIAAIPAQADARSGDAYQKVVRFLDHHPQSEWTNAELQKRLAASGTKIGAKQIGNFAAYLTRCGRFERLARGHYRDRYGNVIVTAEELPTTDMGQGSETEN